MATYLGADHRGYRLKEKLKEHLVSRGFLVTDMGTHSEESVDYPIFAEKVARGVLEDPNNKGILFCGSGAGVCIAANKVKGIRAAVAWDPKIARVARNDDNINVLCLASDSTDLEVAKVISKTFLDTSFAGEERYRRRAKQIKAIEEKN